MIKQRPGRFCSHNHCIKKNCTLSCSVLKCMLIFTAKLNTLWTGDADLRLYITTVQYG